MTNPAPVRQPLPYNGGRVVPGPPGGQQIISPTPGSGGYNYLDPIGGGHQFTPTNPGGGGGGYGGFEPIGGIHQLPTPVPIGNHIPGVNIPEQPGRVVLPVRPSPDLPVRTVAPPQSLGNQLYDMGYADQMRQLSQQNQLQNQHPAVGPNFTQAQRQLVEQGLQRQQQALLQRENQAANAAQNQNQNIYQKQQQNVLRNQQQNVARKNQARAQQKASLQKAVSNVKAKNAKK